MHFAFSNKHPCASKLSQSKVGSVLTVTLIGITIGGLLIGSLLKLVSQNSHSMEKEIGHVKSAQVLKLATGVYEGTVAQNSGSLSTSQIDILKSNISSGSSATIFGTNSNVPGFSQFTVAWDETITLPGTSMVKPTDPNGFWSFSGTMSSKVVVTHGGVGVPALRDGTQALMSSLNPVSVVPAFSMLAFYDRDWEIAAHSESAQLIGHIHSNGNAYLDCRDSGLDRVSFHGMQNYPCLSADKSVFRRGRNGATSHYKNGTYAQAGLDFSVYGTSDSSGTDRFTNATANSNIISTSDFNYTNYAITTFPASGSTTLPFHRDLTPGFTNFESSPKAEFAADTAAEAVARRFGGEGSNFGYVYTGTNTSPSSSGSAPAVSAGNGPDMNAPANATASTPTVAMIQYGDQVERLIPPVAINSYQYVEDIQNSDTPDTEDYPSPVPSNYQEDSAANGSLADLAFNSVAALVIRDGVAYKRSTPGGSLTPVINGLGSNALYPDAAHPNAKKYGDLRWYGHFGSAASPDNPDRWHFPIRSVTFNKTQDAANAGDGSTDAEGTAVPFTFNSATVLNPVNDGVSIGTASWIRRDIDLDEVSAAYPGLNTNSPTANPGGAETGLGIGMWNVSYSVIGTPYGTAAGTTEKFDPVRVAYNLVKAEVRKLHNAVHIYTSRHDGNRMLNGNGTDPGDGVAPDVWGGGINMPNGLKVDLDYDGNNTDNFAAPAAFDENSVLVSYDADVAPEFSAFWNDDGALYNNSGAPVMKAYGRNVLVGASTVPYPYERSSAVPTDVRNGLLTLNSTSPPDTTPRVELFPIRHKSLTNMGTANSQNRVNNWFIYKSTLPLSDRTLPMPINRDCLDGWNYSAGNNDYVDNLGVNNPTIVNRFFQHGSTPQVGGNNTGRATPRCRNFGFSGAKSNASAISATNSAYRNASANNYSFQNWYTLLNNAPEMLARQNETNTFYATNTTPGVTFENDFGYYAGDCGGYYGNDNLCTIDAQEKKILVFTEIDLAELTEECFLFNNIPNFKANTATATSDDLQNILYVVNTSMGKNFFGHRVHCGAVRLKRGALIDFPLSIATPNALHVWGDFNCPGYLHHNKDDYVSYTVPSNYQYSNGVNKFFSNVTKAPVALYADSIALYENNWLPFDQTSGTRDSILDGENGELTAMPLSDAVGGTDLDPVPYMDHKLWWEDDGMRRWGVTVAGMTSTAPNDVYHSTPSGTASTGTQLFLNYHETIFNHANNDFYSGHSCWERDESSPIPKIMPQCVGAGLMYGNVESRLPSVFWQVDVNAIPLSRPASIDNLDWMMSWIPRSRWVELTRDQMRSDLSGTLTNGGVNPSSLNASYFSSGALTLGNYYGTAFPTTGGSPYANGNTAYQQFENCKLKFNGGGFLYDLRPFTNQSHYCVEWVNNRQSLGRNVVGAFTCLYDSRQATHGFNTTMMGTQTQQIFYSYDMDFNNADNLPPGTPMTTIVPNVDYTLEGTKWRYQ